MRIPTPLLQWLQGLRRCYKLAILLFAAWAPFSLPRRPFMAAGILVFATAIFLIATRSVPRPATSETGQATPVDTHP